MSRFCSFFVLTLAAMLLAGCPPETEENKPPKPPKETATGKDAGTITTSPPEDAGTTTSASPEDAGTAVVITSPDAGITTVHPEDAGTTIVDLPQDAGNTNTALPEDAGATEATSPVDAGNSGAIPIVDAGNETELELLSSEEIYLGLRPKCVACHGSYGYMANLFETYAHFEEALVNDAFFVSPGDPENSNLFQRLQGDNAASMMPPSGAGGPYASIEDTDVSMAEIELWILSLTPTMPIDGMDGGLGESVLDAGSETIGEDAGSPMILDAGPGPVIEMLSTEEVYEGLRVFCVSCHGDQSAYGLPMFETLAQFESEVVRNPLLVNPGDPENSPLFHRLRSDNANYMPPSWGYPPGPYESLQNTTVSLAEIEWWLLNLEIEPAIPELDAGVLPTTDAGALPDDLMDAGPEPSAAQDGGVTNEGPLTTEEIYLGLSQTCYGCHSGDYFTNLETFKETIVYNDDFVQMGQPETSQLYLLLVNQGEPTTSLGYTQMPPNSSFQNLAANGQTLVDVTDIYDWILHLEADDISNGTDAGPSIEETDAGSEPAPENDAGSNYAVLDVNADHSEVFLVTNEDEGYEVEADGLMAHEIEVLVMGLHQNQAGGFGANQGTPQPLMGAEVFMTNTQGDLENCTWSNPGTTNAQGKITCRLNSTQVKDSIIDIFAKTNDAQGWVQLYDNLVASFSPCQNARTFFIREVMGPIFTKCTGCHNEYGLGREQGTWFGVLEGEPVNDDDEDFIDVNLSRITPYKGSSQYYFPYQEILHERDSTSEPVPYMVAKPAGLIDPTSPDDMDKPYGHGGGRLFEPGSEDFFLFWELADRLSENKVCPTDSEYLFHNPYAGAVEYNATELYHRATFTLTGEYPSAGEYMALLEHGNFSEADFSNNLDRREPSNGLGLGLNFGSGFNSEPIENTTNNPIMYRDSFYERMGEALEDHLHVAELGATTQGLNSLLNNNDFKRSQIFRTRYDKGLTGNQNKTCVPSYDFDYEKYLKCDDWNLTDEECMLHYGCCEEIGNHENLNSYIPPLDESGQGPQCSQYDLTDPETCAAAVGCQVIKLRGTQFRGILGALHPDTGEAINWNDPGAALILAYKPKAPDQDLGYGYCYTQPNGVEKCSLDSNLSHLAARGFIEGTYNAEGSRIVIPEGTPWAERFPRRILNEGTENQSSQVYTANSAFFPVPWECRHDFCADGERWLSEDANDQTNKLMEAVLKDDGANGFDNDFTHILTSEHYVVNPFVAFLYGIDVNSLVDSQGRIADTGTPLFEPDPNDPESSTGTHYRNQWRKLHYEDIVGPGNRVVIGKEPTVAGVLSTPTFLRRYPTTYTNLNRMRSSEAHEMFLAIDIMSLVSFSVDPNQPLPPNQTMDGFACRVCHAVMDPLGGHFLNYTSNLYQPNGYYAVNNSNTGRIMHDRPYTVANECETEKRDNEECSRAPGYKGSLLGGSNPSNGDYGVVENTNGRDGTPRALAHLAEKITNDHRFSLAITRWLHESLLGLKVLKPPKDRANPDYDAMVAAYVAQSHEIERVRQIFVKNGHDLRDAISAIVTGPIFRIKRAKLENDFQRSVYAYAGVGAGQRLIPEQLNRKIQDTLGYPWREGRDVDNENLLQGTDGFYLMYGGIDNALLLKRDRDPNPISAAIARRMAVEMSCLVVPQEFSHIDALDRNLFRFVDLDTTDEEALREQIQWLFLSLHGEYYHLNHNEVNKALELLLDVATPEDIVASCPENLESHLEASDNFFETNFSPLMTDWIYHYLCLSDIIEYNRDFLSELNDGSITITHTDFNFCSNDLGYNVTLEAGDTLTHVHDYLYVFFENKLAEFDCTQGIYPDSDLMLNVQSITRFTSDLCYLDFNDIALPPDYDESSMPHHLQSLINYRHFVENGYVTEDTAYDADTFEQCPPPEAISSTCAAAKDFFTETSLADVTGRRTIDSSVDNENMVIAWQALLTAMLSDYKYLYE